MSSKELIIQSLKNKIDDYLNTVYAIIGFLNTYKFEMEKANKDIVLFQGRKLWLDESNGNFVTPDFGLSINEISGLVGEVKYSFPSDKKLWIDTFTQIKKYDQIISGWPTSSGNVSEFDIVLLVQQSRSRSVIDYYLKKLPAKDKVNKTFAILEFNRASQGKEYFHFRIEHGTLSDKQVSKKFMEGLYVPYDIYITKYSTIKLYDTEPPLPLLLQLIYDCVIDQLKGEGKFKKMTKKTKQLVTINSHHLTKTLKEVYSFKRLQSEIHLNGQPEFPKHEWIKNALDKIFEMGEGNWLDKSTGSFSYILTQKDGNILDYYIKKSIGLGAAQTELF